MASCLHLTKWFLRRTLKSRRRNVEQDVTVSGFEISVCYRHDGECQLYKYCIQDIWTFDGCFPYESEKLNCKLENFYIPNVFLTLCKFIGLEVHLLQVQICCKSNSSTDVTLDRITNYSSLYFAKYPHRKTF